VREGAEKGARGWIVVDTAIPAITYDQVLTLKRREEGDETHL
jgi:hypothetical protein